MWPRLLWQLNSKMSFTASQLRDAGGMSLMGELKCCWCADGLRWVTAVSFSTPPTNLPPAAPGAGRRPRLFVTDIHTAASDQYSGTHTDSVRPQTKRCRHTVTSGIDWLGTKTTFWFIFDVTRWDREASHRRLKGSSETLLPEWK